MPDLPLIVVVLLAWVGLGLLLALFLALVAGRFRSGRNRETYADPQPAPGERRKTPGERRAGRPDTRTVRTERRRGAPDRRLGPRPLA